jgi:hypothetical protein
MFAMPSIVENSGENRSASGISMANVLSTELDQLDDADRVDAAILEEVDVPTKAPVGRLMPNSRRTNSSTAAAACCSVTRPRSEKRWGLLSDTYRRE